MERNIRDRKIESLQALRGLACLLVILEHVSFLKCGVFAVDIFFVLSGFMIVLSTEKGAEHFLSKRIIRIVPFYWLMTILAFIGIKLVPWAFESTKAGIKELIYSMFFVPFDINTGSAFTQVTGENVMQPLMRIGWTLNLEMLFYLVFFVALKLSFKYRALLAGAFLIILVTLGNLTGIGNRYPALSIWTSALLIEFVFGMAAFYMFKMIKTVNVPRTVSLIAGVIIPIVLLTLAILRKEGLYTDVNRLLIWGIPALILVLCALIYDKNLKTPGFLVFAGDISFSIYYVHYYIIRTYDRLIADKFGMSVISFAGLAVALLLTVLISCVTYELIEKRLTKALLSALIK